MSSLQNRLIVLVAILCVAWSAQSQSLQILPIPNAPDSMQARLAACAPCHGDHGEGVTNDYFPRLAGKPEGYLYNQLTAFRSGRRHYAPMNYLLAYMPDAYLHTISAYFAAWHSPLPAPSNSVAAPDSLARGQALVSHGDAAHGIPACVGCHGPGYTGMEPAIPGLLGLKAAYISAQLGAWRYGTRTATAPDCMQIVASHLSERDVTDVAAWLASAMAPQNSVPLPQGSLATPLVCGSEPQ